ncbi:MAG TPA: lytic transglycosylase domain-containing protein [Rectinemataceae bacterium]|nr:lytic transglycosylase domain-containing protein [Rectinemataceae bacterium]
MQKPIFAPHKRQSLGLTLFVFSLALSSCEAKGPFGLSGSMFSGILDNDNRAAIIGLPARDFDEPGPEGPAAWYYTALWLDKGKPEVDASTQAAREALVQALFAKAASSATGFIRDDARLRLVRSLAEEARAASPAQSEAAWEALLTATLGVDSSDEIVADRLEALAGLSRWPQLRAAASSLLHDDIGRPSADDGAALYARALADKRLGLHETAADLAGLLSLGSGPWVAKGLALAAEEDQPDLVPPALLAKARLFQAIEARDYGAAYRAAKTLLPELRQSPTRELIGAIGKAWLFSGMSKEGIGLMDSVIAADRSSIQGGSPAWTASFYKARMLVALRRYGEAASILYLLSGNSGSDKDRDSCLYYALDAQLRYIDGLAPPEGLWKTKALRDRALAPARLLVLEAASRTWKDPSTFTDLVEPLFRDLVADGDWNEVDAFAGSLAERASPFLASRLLYVSGRARELGLVTDSPPRPLVLGLLAATEAGPARGEDEDIASRRFKAVLDLYGGPEYYFLASSARLGIDIRPWGKEKKARKAILFEPQGTGKDLAGAVKGLIDFGLPSFAWDLASKNLDAMDDGDLLSLSKKSQTAGSYIASMRFANGLVSRYNAIEDRLSAEGRAILPDREMYELLFPRPWRAELDSALAPSVIPEFAAYALLRSESWFDPGVRSGAGAVGLSQLMPSTAREIARNLGMAKWSLSDPGDNLHIGMAMLHDLFEENDGHILRAAFAYNAGRGRLRRWIAESGGYPDDLFLERLSIAETREYGRKIVTAGAWYAALYEGSGSSETVRAMIAGFPTGK